MARKVEPGSIRSTMLKALEAIPPGDEFTAKRLVLLWQAGYPKPMRYVVAHARANEAIRAALKRGELLRTKEGAKRGIASRYVKLC